MLAADDKMVMNSLSVSIIIPVFNVEPYIEACLQSVMRQTYEGPIECIIVDDGSTDKSITIAEGLISKYQGPIVFKVLHHDHTRGASAARNTGMDTATGDYFYFLDSDDELTRDCIEKLTEPLKKDRYDVVVGNFDVVLGDGILFYQGQNLLIPDNTILYGEEILNAYKSKMTPITSWNKLCSADVVRRIGCRFQEGIMMEDVLWEFQIACCIHTMYCVNQNTYIYKRRTDSVMTSSSWELKAYCYYVIFVEMWKFAHDKGVDYVLVHDILQENYHLALKCYRNVRKEFVRTYRQMRSYYSPSLQMIIKGNRCRFKRCIRDIHHILPLFVAPYWCYYINYHLLPILPIKKNNNG